MGPTTRLMPSRPPPRSAWPSRGDLPPEPSRTPRPPARELDPSSWPRSPRLSRPRSPRPPRSPQLRRLPRSLPPKRLPRSLLPRSPPPRSPLLRRLPRSKLDILEQKKHSMYLISYIVQTLKDEHNSVNTSTYYITGGF